MNMDYSQPYNNFMGNNPGAQQQFGAYSGPNAAGMNSGPGLAAYGAANGNPATLQNPQFLDSVILKVADVFANSTNQLRAQIVTQIFQKCSR